MGAAYFLLCATLTVWIGSHRSLDSQVVQTIQFDDAKFVPVYAATSLVGLYTLITVFHLDISGILTLYFSLIGTLCTTTFLAPNLVFLGRQAGLTALTDTKLALPVPEGFTMEGEDSVTTTPMELLALVLAVAAVACDASNGHTDPFLNNLIALSIAGELLQAVSLESYITAAVVSAGLLTYDFLAVFKSGALASLISSGQSGETIMVSVAKSADGPMKIIFPNGNASGYPFSILGLGDIVVPALVAGLCLRADKRLQADGIRQGSPGTRPFFNAAMVGYILGLGVTVVVSKLTDSAQPALIYLCPSIIATTSFCAWSRGELQDLLSYREASKGMEQTETD